ncbi:hypothetical protein [Halosegnis sp.]|uniref:hypothetical protein n=1 Tax=Halosegnis sp. TaxID=2864959 RepID=UPI0035D3E464
MHAFAAPLQLVPSFGVPGILSTLILIVVVILVARVVLSIALKVAIVAAIVAGVLWFFGLLRLVPFL